MIATSINNEYVLRMAGVALVIAGMGAWFAYDGAAGYPKKNAAHARFAEKARALEKAPTAAEWLRKDDGEVSHIERFARDEANAKLPSSILAAVKDTQARIEQIHQKEPDTKKASDEAKRLEEGLAQKILEPPYGAGDLHTQFGFAAAAFLFAVSLVGFLAWRASIRFTADDTGVTRGGERFDWADLSAVDWAQWRHKHIARLSFGGRVLKLDGWFYARVDDIVALMLEKRKDFTMPDEPAKKE